MVVVMVMVKREPPMEVLEAEGQLTVVEDGLEGNDIVPL